MVSAGNLFWHACKKEVSMKKSVVSHHIYYFSQTQGCSSKSDSQRKNYNSIVDALQKYEENGETLPDANKAFRDNIV